MSFDNTKIRPKLVETKIIERIIKVQKIIEDNNITVFKQIKTFLYNFFINHIGTIIILLLLTILLWYRYKDVQKRKKDRGD